MVEILQQILVSIQDLKESIEGTTEDKYLTRKEVGVKYNLTVLEVSKLFKAKGFPVINVGRTQRVSQKSLEKFLKQGIKIKIDANGKEVN